jgi:hypothetical protein
MFEKFRNSAAAAAIMYGIGATTVGVAGLTAAPNSASAKILNDVDEGVIVNQAVKTYEIVFRRARTEMVKVKALVDREKVRQSHYDARKAALSSAERSVFANVEAYQNSRGKSERLIKRSSQGVLNAVLGSIKNIARVFGMEFDEPMEKRIMGIEDDRDCLKGKKGYCPKTDSYSPNDGTVLARAISFKDIKFDHPEYKREKRKERRMDKADARLEERLEKLRLEHEQRLEKLAKRRDKRLRKATKASRSQQIIKSYQQDVQKEKKAYEQRIRREYDKYTRKVRRLGGTPKDYEDVIERTGSDRRGHNRYSPHEDSRTSRHFNHARTGGERIVREFLREAEPFIRESIRAIRRARSHDDGTAIKRSGGRISTDFRGKARADVSTDPDTRLYGNVARVRSKDDRVLPTNRP